LSALVEESRAGLQGYLQATVRKLDFDYNEWPSLGIKQRKCHDLTYLLKRDFWMLSELERKESGLMPHPQLQ
jgi:hypothetical protein